MKTFQNLQGSFKQQDKFGGLETTATFLSHFVYLKREKKKEKHTFIVTHGIFLYV